MAGLGLPLPSSMTSARVHINLEVEGDGQSIRIVAVNEGGQLSKVRPLDRLVMVDSQSVSGKTAEEVSRMMSGSDGSEVTLTTTRPAESGALTSSSVLRTSTPEIDRQVATLRQIQAMVVSKEEPAYWRPSTTADGKVFAEVIACIKEYQSKSGGGDAGFGLGAIFKWLWSPFMGAAVAQNNTSVPMPQPQAGMESQVLVLRLAQGDYFGEIALLSNKPRQATVKAFGNATVLVMSRDAFTRLCGNLMDILRRNLDNYSNMELPSPDEITGPGAEKGHVAFAEETEQQFREETVVRQPRKGRERRKSVYVESVKLEADWQPPHFEKEEDEKQRLSEHISKTALLASLDTKARDTVINAVQKETFAPGSNVIVQGDPGDYFYILDAGTCDVLIKQADGGELKVLAYAPGGSFGELALLHGEPRLATVRASAAVTVWKLDRDTFRKIMMSTGKQSMDDRVKFLNKVSILNDLSTFEKFKVAESMEVRNYKDEETIVEEGEDGGDFFIIESGACHCFKKHMSI